MSKPTIHFIYLASKNVNLLNTALLSASKTLDIQFIDELIASLTEKDRRKTEIENGKKEPNMDRKARGNRLYLLSKNFQKLSGNDAPLHEGS